MDIITTAEGWAFLLRYIHFLAGITWIGILYYFNFIQTPFFGSELGGQAKGQMIRGLLPNALWWFRWGAMLTFISGWLIILIRLHQGITLAQLSPILTGGVMGTLMWANVWFVIWPAQQVVIRSAEQTAGGGEAIAGAAARGARAGLASRTNTLFSIPLLFFMGAQSHWPSLAAGMNTTYWLIAGILMLAVEINALIGPGLVTQKPLGSVSGTIHAGLALTLVLFIVALIA